MQTCSKLLPATSMHATPFLLKHRMIQTFSKTINMHTHTRMLLLSPMYRFLTQCHRWDVSEEKVESVISHDVPDHLPPSSIDRTCNFTQSVCATKPLDRKRDEAKIGLLKRLPEGSPFVEDRSETLFGCQQQSLLLTSWRCNLGSDSWFKGPFASPLFLL